MEMPAQRKAFVVSYQEAVYNCHLKHFIIILYIYIYFVLAPSYAVTVRHLNYATDTPLNLVTITLGV